MGIFKVLSHLSSNETAIGRRKRQRLTDSAADQLTLKDRMSLILALKLIGQNKMSAFKATSSSMIEVYEAILLAAGVAVEKDNFVPSRRSIMRTVNEFSNKIRDSIKNEICGQKVSLIHDDSR